MGLFKKTKKKQKVNDSDYGGFVVSKNVVDGKAIKYIYREKSSIDNLNGWTIYSCEDSDEYVNNPDNFVILGATSMAQIAPMMLVLFDAPYGTDLCWMYDEKGRHTGFYDLAKDEETSIEKILEEDNH